MTIATINPKSNKATEITQIKLTLHRRLLKTAKRRRLDFVSGGEFRSNYERDLTLLIRTLEKSIEYIDLFSLSMEMRGWIMKQCLGFDGFGIVFCEQIL